MDCSDLLDEADVIKEDICTTYRKYGDRIELVVCQSKGKKYIFEVKPKGNTREAHIYAHASDVKLRLKLPLFHVVKHNLTLYIIASRHESKYDSLSKVLNQSHYWKTMEQMWLPYVVGYDALGELVIEDLADLLHLLLGGSTNSGKSVALQALIISIAFSVMPAAVNFVLIDVGARDLMPFEGLPHLSCPIVQDRATAMYVLAALRAEMERRIELEHTSPGEFEQLPRIVLVIDEFPALFTGLMDKDDTRMIADSISSLLQRGRHAKIHLVLAAQNPTYQNMKVDLGNITARIAFKCAKKNYSETILDEGGAECLAGHGELLAKFPEYDAPQWMQGIYITPQKLQKLVQRIKDNPNHTGVMGQKFLIPYRCLSAAGIEEPTLAAIRLHCPPVPPKPTAEEQLLAKVMLWALSQNSISANKIQNEFHVGWKKATQWINKLEALGVVEKQVAKLSRRVIPAELSDLPNEMLGFLEENGIDRDAIDCAFQGR